MILQYLLAAATTIGLIVICTACALGLMTLWWHTHLTACGLIAEARAVRRKGLWRWTHWPKCIHLFICRWVRDWSDKDVELEWPGVARWHSPEHVWSLGHMVWLDQ